MKNIFWVPKLLGKVIINAGWFPAKLRDKLPVNRFGDSDSPRSTLTGYLAHYLDFIRGRLGTSRELFCINVLEIGPGYAPAAAYINYWIGGGRTWLLDIGCFLKWGEEEVRELSELVRMLCREVWFLPSRSGPAEDRLLRMAHAVSACLPTRLDRADLVAGIEKRIKETLQCRGVEQGLQLMKTKILTRGLDSYPEIMSGSIDFSFSTGVLQSIKKKEIEPALREIFRSLTPGGVTSHFIGLNDFLVDSLNQLTVPEWLWESPFIYRAHTYVNRTLAGDWRALFNRVGFEELKFTPYYWEKLPVLRGRLQPEFRCRCDEELRIKNLGVVYRKPGMKLSGIEEMNIRQNWTGNKRLSPL